MHRSPTTTPASEPVCLSVSQPSSKASIGSDDKKVAKATAPSLPSATLQTHTIRKERIRSSPSITTSALVLSCPALPSPPPLHPHLFFPPPRHPKGAGGPIPSGPPNPRRRGCSHTTHSLSSSATCRGHSSWRWRWRTTTKWRVPSREFPPPYSRHPIFFLFTFY